MKKILIIEDDAAIRENTAELLALNGFEIVTAENGRTGYAAATREAPDLILCDMMMPETDGRGFIALARKDSSISQVPVLFFSAGTVSPKVHQYLTSHSVGFLRKPFLAEDLIDAVNKALERSHAS